MQLEKYLNLTAPGQKPDNAEDLMVQYVAAHGPISIGINANMMQFYLKGIANPNGHFWTRFMCSEKMMNHGVIIVGYGEAEKRSIFGRKKVVPYWIIKNSWGAKYGRQGYYYIQRGSNNCGLANFVSAPIVKRKAGTPTNAPNPPRPTPLPTIDE